MTSGSHYAVRLRCTWCCMSVASQYRGKGKGREKDTGPPDAASHALSLSRLGGWSAPCPSIRCQPSSASHRGLPSCRTRLTSSSTEKQAPHWPPLLPPCDSPVLTCGAVPPAKSDPRLMPWVLAPPPNTHTLLFCIFSLLPSVGSFLSYNAAN